MLFNYELIVCKICVPPQKKEQQQQQQKQQFRATPSMQSSWTERANFYPEDFLADIFMRLEEEKSQRGNTAVTDKEIQRSNEARHTKVNVECSGRTLSLILRFAAS